MKQTHSTTKLLAAAIFELIIAIDLLFPAWLGMDVYLASGSASLWRVGKLMSTLANYAGSDSNFLYTLISIIIYILLVLSLVAVVLTGRSLYQAYKKKDTPVKMAGFVIPAVLSVLVILVVVIGNAIVSSESDGWITSVFFLKGAPIINLILAVLGIALFFTPTPIGGIVFLFLAFLLSPYGLQAAAGSLLWALDGGKSALYRFLAS